MIGRYVARRDYEEFKDKTEGNIIKLALDAKSHKEQLDWLIAEFIDFKDKVYTHMDATVNAIQGLKQEQAFTNQTLKDWEPKIEKIDKIDGIEKKIDEINHKLNEIGQIKIKLDEIGQIKIKLDEIGQIKMKLDEIGKKLT